MHVASAEMASRPVLAFTLLSLTMSACAGDADDVDTGSVDTGSTSAATEPDPSTSSASGNDSTGPDETSGGSSTTLDATDSATDDTQGESDTRGLECDALPRGPFTPELFTDAFSGSEDIGFDGKGSLAGKAGQDVILVDAQGQTSVLASGVGTAYGLRFLPTGELVIALPQAGTLVRVTPDGTVSNWVTGLSGPNGVYPDHDGNVWVTEFSGSRITRVDPNGDTTTIAQGGPELAAPNGIVWDPDRRLLYYTNYQAQRVRALPMNEQGDFGDPILVAVLPANGPDGLVLDACGNLYVVAQQSNEIWRIWLDEQGGPVGDPELIASLPTNAANAQFGSGPGFDPTSLYAAGVPGDVYRIEIGVPGAPIPTVP